MPTPRGADRLLTLAAAALGLLFVLRAACLLSSPYPVEYGEGTTWSYARLLATQGTYFLPIDREPYIHGTYPPLFPLLQRLLGGTLAAGRGVALAGALLAAFALATTLHALGLRPARAALWSVVFLGTPAAHEWSALCRVDTLALGLSLLGVAIATRHAERQAGELAAAPILALALYAKQVALAAPAAVLLSLVRRGERRRAWVFAAVYLDFVLLGIGILYWRFGMEAWRHLVTYAGFVGLAAGPALRWGLRFVFQFPVLLALGLSGLRGMARTPAGLWALFGLLTLGLAGKPGAAANYLLEPSAAVVLLGALGAERALAERASQPERRRDLTLLLVLQMVILCEPGRPLELHDLRRERRVEAAVVEALARAPGPVLAEDLGLVLAAGKEPMLEPFQFSLLAQAGRFDPAPVLASVRAGKFGVIVSGARLRAIPGFAPALQSRYRLAEETGPYQIWRP